MLRAFGQRGRLAMGLALVAWAGCRNYGALDQTVQDGASTRADLASSPPDFALYSCDAGILCETFDNAPLGDEWVALSMTTGTATVDPAEAFAGPLSLEIYAPNLSSGATADPGVSHGFTLGAATIDGVHVREMVYCRSRSRRRSTSCASRARRASARCGSRPRRPRRV